MDRPSRRTRLALAGLLTVFLFLATIYNATSTPFEAPDEVGHFYYVIYLLQDGRLPVVSAEEPDPDHPSYEHEGVQPPLYYASAAFVVRLLERPLHLDLDDAGLPLTGNPHSTCGQPGARYNVAYFSHDPHRLQFPYKGRIRVLHVVRLWSSLLGMATVAGVFAATRLAFPGTRAAAWLAAGLVAFTPEFLFAAGAVNNDNLVTALSTWGVYLTLRVLRDGLHWSRTLALGVLAGLATLAKFSGALLLPLSLLAVLVALVLRKPKSSPLASTIASRWPSIIGHSLLVTGAFLVISGWWFLRNWTLYGDLTGTLPMLEILSLRQDMSVSVLIRELPGLFRSWWGTFGCTAPPGWFYLPYLALVLGGLAGLVVDRRRMRRNWPVVGIWLAWLALMFVAYVRWNWIIHAAKGRLLYPAMVVVAGLLGRGWAAWSGRYRWLAPALLGLSAMGAVAVPFTVMIPAVSPPPIYSSVADVHPGQPLDGRFGSEIGLVGYDLDATSLEPGDWLDLTLYWHALAQPPEHYVLAIQLVSAVPHDTATLVNFNTWTGGGSYPTGYWHPGDVIADHYQLQIPDQVPRAQGWYLQVVLFHLDGGARLPFRLNGEPAGDAFTLGRLRVGGTNPEEQAPPSDYRLASPVHFGGVMALDGVRVTEEEGTLRVTLWWRSVALAVRDAVVFVHLYDAKGQPIATADAPPLDGGFSTSLWRPGDRIRDERVVPLPPTGDVPSQLGVGWYDPDTGVRLVATDAAGVRLPHDVFMIPVSR